MMLNHNIPTRCSAIALLFGLSMLAGCGTSPLARYPEFPLKKSQNQSTIILSDAVIIETLVGDTANVDILENTKLAKMCLNMLAGGLNEKGYHVDRTLISSVGLVMNHDRVYKVMRTSEDEHQDIELLDIASPPFFVDEIFRNDSLLEQHLRTLYIRLLYTERKKGQPTIRIPEATTISQRLGGGLVFVLLIGGYNVPVTNQMGKYTQTENLTMDKVSIQQVTQVSIMLYVLDGETGEVLWDDRSIKKGGLIYKEKLVSMLQDLLNEFP